MKKRRAEPYRPPRTGLTPFLCELIGPKMTVARLQAMDVAKVAKHYAIREAWVIAYRDQQLELRGALEQKVIKKGDNKIISQK